MPPTTEQIDNINVLALIKEAHQAASAAALRQSVVYGLGTLIESVSCVWTELDANLFQEKPAVPTIANINDPDIDVPSAIAVFNQYAWQHPVLAPGILTGDIKVLSISDLLSRENFKILELYQLFYKHQSIEDQLSAGYTEKGILKGLSVNRSSWGFTENERLTLTHIVHCVFPFYRLLQKMENSEPPQLSLIEANINQILEYNDALEISVREAQMLSLVAVGKSNKVIASDCNISEGTVRKHLENCFRKLSVNNRVSAVIKVMGIINNIKA